MANFTDDAYMTYDTEVHMYTGTSDLVQEILEAQEETMTEQELGTILKMVRNDFYAECLDWAVYRDRYLFYLSLPDQRGYIKEAMRMIFEDLVINKSTPGLSFNDKDISLVTPRTRKYMQVTKLLLKQGLIDDTRIRDMEKGVDW